MNKEARKQEVENKIGGNQEPWKQQTSWEKACNPRNQKATKQTAINNAALQAR